MNGMILAAGEGTRLQPLTFLAPKPMVPILNRPVMAYLVEHLVRHQVAPIWVNLHYLPDRIEGYFGNGETWGAEIRYSREESLMGTAGGVKKLAPHFRDTFLVIGGDDLTDMNLTAQLEFHRKVGAKATIGLKRVDDVTGMGVVVIESDGRVREFQEKPRPDEAKSDLVNTGIYLFEPEILDLIPDGTVYDFGRQLFPLLLEKGIPFYGYPFEDYWCDIGSLKDYKQSHWDILNEGTGLTPPGRLMRPGVWMGERVEIGANVRIIPPVLIGEGTVIGEGVSLIGPVSVGERVRINHDSHLEQSILWDGIKVGSKVHLVDCVVGSDVVISPHQTFHRCVFNEHEISVVPF